MVGGGPAGASTAITAATLGARVTLLERSLPGSWAPGESLHPGVEPLFDRLGVGDQVRAAEYLRHRGHWVQWHRPVRFESFGADARGPWFGFQAVRRQLDDLLLDRAAASGVRVLRGHPALDAELDGAGPRIVHSSAGLHRAEVLVDATGGRHWVSRRVGATVHRLSPRLLAMYGRTRGRAGETADAPTLRADDNGWTWIAPTGDGRSSWVRLTLGRRNPRSPPPELDGERETEPARGADVTWRIAADPDEQRFVVVGDAGAVIDPAGSHGVLRAILSGMLAGHAVGQVVRGEIDRAEVAREVATWMRQLFAHDVSALDEMYADFHAWAPIATLPWPTPAGSFATEPAGVRLS